MCLVIDADLFFGPESILMMSYFTEPVTGPGLFFSKALGLTILHLCAGPYAFGADKGAFAKIWLSANILNSVLFTWVKLTIETATIMWWIQLGGQLPIIVFNFMALKGVLKGTALF